MKKLPLLIALVCYLVACTPAEAPPQPEPERPDGGPGDDMCGAKCKRQRELGCSGAEPTKSGASCEEVCRNAERNEIYLAGTVECSKMARECAAILACSR